MPNIKLQSADGDVISVDKDVARLSITIKTMLEGLSYCTMFEFKF